MFFGIKYAQEKVQWNNGSEQAMVLQAALDARMGGGGSEAALINKAAAVAVAPRPKDAALQPKRRLEVEPVNGTGKRQQVLHSPDIAAALWLSALPVSNPALPVSSPALPALRIDLERTNATFGYIYLCQRLLCACLRSFVGLELCVCAHKQSHLASMKRSYW